MRLNINLATQPYEDARRFWLRWGAGLAAAVILSLGLIFAAVNAWIGARHDRQQMAEIRQQIARCEDERAKAEAVLNRPENRTMREQSQFVNGLISRKAFSWTQVFADLERMMPPGLHVTSIQPELSKDNQLQIKMNVGGQSMDRALELVHRMEKSPQFHDPHITEQNFNQGSTSGDAIQSQVVATYLPQPSGEKTR
jgi:type IV pilus assembly protein PilN